MRETILNKTDTLRWIIRVEKKWYWTKPIDKTRWWWQDVIRKYHVKKDSKEIYQKVREKHNGGVPVFFICDEVKKYRPECCLNGFNGSRLREECYNEYTNYIRQNPCKTLCILCVTVNYMICNE